MKLVRDTICNKRYNGLYHDYKSNQSILAIHARGLMSVPLTDILINLQNVLGNQLEYEFYITKYN